jgi:anthraniloyl-CoA monooxygenase
MRIACLGGGPAGLYFAISMKLRDPGHEIVVVERNRAGDTFGWGVVFSDQTLANLRANDAVSAATIETSFAHWDDIVVERAGQSMRSSGHGFIGIGRKRLLQILQARAAELGVELRFETDFDDDLDAWKTYDLIVACDGVNSRLRTSHQDKFQVDIDIKANKFTWLGTTKLFDAFNFIFEKTSAGWIWAHAYRFDATHSTFIVECSPETWAGLGLDKREPEQAIALCEKIFARQLDGHRLISNATHLRGSAAWINFRRVLCGEWFFDNVVLLGDAAHTAHFSIGSGTKLALEDAIKLAAVLDRAEASTPQGLRAALVDYQAERQVEVLKIQNSARNSTEWFETLDRYIGFDLTQFTYSLLTRSQRVSHENLRLRDSVWLSGVERWFSGSEQAIPPMFTPYTLRGLRLANRVVVSPILTYECGADAIVGDFHLVHYGARAQGGAGLVLTEMAAVVPEGRYTAKCPGLWNAEQTSAWTRIVDFVHRTSDAKIGVQLGHAGAKGEGAWPLVSASGASWSPHYQTPTALSAEGVREVMDAFAAAAQRAVDAGFDLVEIQAGHGTLLSSFITPILNQRADEYGGSFENRLRLPLAVLRAVRAVLPYSVPLSVRISANDWMGADGITPDQSVKIAAAFKAAGADLIDVSSGETAVDGKPVYGRMYQTPFADGIRNEAHVPTMAVGNIYEADHVNSILAAGRADLVALGRPHLANPMWTLHEAVRADYRGVRVPDAYSWGVKQMSRLSHAKEAARA